MNNAFGLYELLPTGSKVRAFEVSFATVAEAIAHFGNKVIDYEISEDGEACDMFVNVGGGAVYAVERIR